MKVVPCLILALMLRSHATTETAPARHSTSAADNAVAAAATPNVDGSLRAELAADAAAVRRQINALVPDALPAGAVRIRALHRAALLHNASGCARPSAEAEAAARAAPLLPAQALQRLLRARGGGLERGRRCRHGACQASSCALAVLDGIATEGESRRLRALHADPRTPMRRAGLCGSCWTARGSRAALDPALRAAASAGGGGALASDREELFLLRMIERLRWAAAALFGLPPRSLLVASHFLSRRSADSASLGTGVHVDENSDASYHYR